MTASAASEPGPDGQRPLPRGLSDPTLSDLELSRRGLSDRGRLAAALRSRAALCLMALVLMVVGGACRTDVDLDVQVNEDGSGLVTATVLLDQEAAAAVLDLPREGLALEDLFQAGWEITPPEADDAGAFSVSAQKAFGTPDQFAEVMAELAGTSGLVEPFSLERTKSFATVNYRVEGAIAPSGFEAFSDDELSASLGRSVTEIAERYGAGPSDVTITVTVRLPGTIDPEVSNGTLDPEGADSGRIYTTRLDATTPTAIAVESSTREVAALVWRGIAIVAAALAGLVAFGHLLRVLRPERRSNQRRRPEAAARPKKPASQVIKAAEVAEPDESEESDLPAVVALDGMGVLYRQGDDINQLLVPFVRERGSEVSHDKIVARARSMSLGRITPADFWTAVGLEGDPNELDDAYLNLFTLSPGVIKFLRYLRENGVRVACITNDSTVWATKLRAKQSLDGLIDPWIVSGAVGVRKPDEPIYEVLRRLTQAPPSNILVVDDELDNLDAARRLGFRTAWFSPDAPSEDARQHAILRSFHVETVPAGD